MSDGRVERLMRTPFALAALLVTAGCGGGAPLLHAVHAVSKGDVTMGAGFSGTTAPRELEAAGTSTDLELLQASTVSPGLAPWVGARLGFGGGVDAGLTYAGRAVRLDGRRVFGLSSGLDLSVGLGATGLLPQRNEALALRIGGQGLDVPLLVGWRSAGEIYSVWLGPRGGFEWLRGQRELPPDPSTPSLLVTERIGGRHGWVGGVAGLRIGFRHVFALLEVDGAVHFADLEIAGRQTTATAVAFAPAGALVAKF